MKSSNEIGPGIWAAAGPDITDDRDAYAYLITDGNESALIDSGAGPSYRDIVSNIRAAGVDPETIRYIIATHAHIDHIGSLAHFKRDFPLTIVAHALDASAIETADPYYTAAAWYGLRPEPIEVDVKIEAHKHILNLGGTDIICLHTPGHTPGSLSVYMDKGGVRYLFGQDIHGPFHPSFKSSIPDWRASMAALIDLEADVLAEGHYGIIRGRTGITDFIYSFLKANPE